MALLSVLCMATLGFGQVSNIESFGNSNVQEVDASTLNIHLEGPIVSKAGVGQGFDVTAKINNTNWVLFNNPGGFKQWNIAGVGDTAIFGGLQSYSISCTGGGGNDGTLYTRYTEPNGRTHLLANGGVIVPAGICSGSTNNSSALI